MDNAWDLAYEDYIKGMKYKDIAEKYNVSLNTVKSWKTRKWNNKGMHTNDKKVCTQKEKRKRGAPKGNKNATGPPGNKNAETHGFFSKYLPEDTLSIIQEIQDKDPLDILWDNIQIQYAAIIRSQNLMHVKSQEDLTKVLKKEVNGDSSYTVEYELQFAWDKQANFLQAQSRAMKTLESMLKNYDELLNKRWDLATEEQKARISMLKSKINEDETSTEDDGFIGALEGKVDEVWED